MSDVRDKFPYMDVCTSKLDLSIYNFMISDGMVFDDLPTFHDEMYLFLHWVADFNAVKEVISC